MKPKILIVLVVLALVSLVQAGFFDQLFSFFKRERSHIKTVLYELRERLDVHLIELFPELKGTILKLHKDIDQCYDRTIGSSGEEVDILQEKVHKVVISFFKKNGYLLKGLSLKQVHRRVRIFVGNLAELVQLLLDCIARKAEGLETYKLGLTPLAIYSREEIEAKILNKRLKTKAKVKLGFGALLDLFKFSRSNPLDELCSLEARPNETLPTSFSWLDRQKVSPVYNQLNCSACYVFATTSALESQYMIRTDSKVPPRYSVQATLNCMEDGCDGGGLEAPLQHFIDVGVTKAVKAPYLNKVSTCSKEYPSILRANHYCYHTGIQDEQMQLLLMRNGPAAVAIDASSRVFTYLKNAPFTGECGRRVDHAMLLVGWTPQYWIIKNSWSDRWGINGYLYLPRGSNKCGINLMFGQPIVTEV